LIYPMNQWMRRSTNAATSGTACSPRLNGCAGPQMLRLAGSSSTSLHHDLGSTAAQGRICCDRNHARRHISVKREKRMRRSENAATDAGSALRPRRAEYAATGFVLLLGVSLVDQRLRRATNAATTAARPSHPADSWRNGRAGPRMLRRLDWATISRGCGGETAAQGHKCCDDIVPRGCIRSAFGSTAAQGRICCDAKQPTLSRHRRSIIGPTNPRRNGCAGPPTLRLATPPVALDSTAAQGHKCCDHLLASLLHVAALEKRLRRATNAATQSVTSILMDAQVLECCDKL